VSRSGPLLTGFIPPRSILGYKRRMHRLLPLMLLLPAIPAAAQPNAVVQLCATNPAYSQDVMRSVLDAQLQRDHDPALDSKPPEEMAAETAQLGIQDCAKDLTANPGIIQALTGLSQTDMQVAWDAYNTNCDDRRASKAECMKAEVGSAQALRHMVKTDQPDGARALVQACQLVLVSDLAMTEWRLCVDQGLAVHAPPAKAAQCKTSVNWHVAKTGQQAGAEVASCLRR
jgi:hypothetical protein